MTTKSCALIADRLPDWVAGRLSGADAGAVEAHVSACADCAADAAALRAVLAGRAAAPPDLARRIAEAARAGAPRGLRPAGRSGSPRRSVPAWALSTAAALALAVGTAVVLDRPSPAEPEGAVEPALGELAAVDDGGVWIAEDALVAGAPVLEELSEDDLTVLLREMGE